MGFVDVYAWAEWKGRRACDGGSKRVEGLLKWGWGGNEEKGRVHQPRAIVPSRNVIELTN